MTDLSKEAKIELLMKKPVDELTDEQVSEILETETQKFTSLGVELTFDLLRMSQLEQVIVDVLIEAGLTTREDIDALFRRKIVSKMREIREQGESMLTRAKIMHGVHTKISEIKPLGGIENGG